MKERSVWSFIRFYKCLENSWRFYFDFCVVLPEGVFVCEWKEQGNRKRSVQNEFACKHHALEWSLVFFLKEILFWKKILSTKCNNSEALPLSFQTWQFITINFFYSFYRKWFWIGKESGMREEAENMTRAFLLA